MDAHEFDAAAVARAVLARREQGAGHVPILTMEQAYQAQDALNLILEQERGWKRIGYKVGATNAPSRKTLKLDKPFWGRLYREMSERAPGKPPFKPHLTKSVEVEIAVEIGRDLDGSDGPYDAAKIKAATRSLAPVFEIVGMFADAAGPEGSPGLVADFAGHARWILGPTLENFGDLDVLEAPILGAIENGPSETGKGAAVDGGPFASTAFLANELNKRGLMLKAGDFVSTGTVIKPLPAQAAGEKISADFGALGRIELVFS